jgi:hypothetical protein
MVEAPGYIFIKSIDISVTVRSRSNLKTVLNRFEHDESFKKNRMAISAALIIARIYFAKMKEAPGYFIHWSNAISV